MRRRRLHRRRHEEGKQLQRRCRGGAGKCDNPDGQRPESGGAAGSRLETIQIEHRSPLLIACQFGTSLAPITRGQPFQNVCAEAAKWFHPGEEMFRRRVT